MENGNHSLIYFTLCPHWLKRRKVKGSIYDYQHNPLVGVNISLGVLIFGTVSDIDGKFILDLLKQVGIWFLIIPVLVNTRSDLNPYSLSLNSGVNPNQWNV